MKTIFVFVLGIMVGTIGVTGVANIAQKGVDQIQHVAREAAK